MTSVVGNLSGKTSIT